MVLAVAGLRDRRGRPLPGARREVRSLSWHYRDVDVRLVGPDDAALAVPGLDGFDLVHVASHTSIEDERPWRSGIVLGGAVDGVRMLRADEIAGHTLAARLAVLSGCESAGSRESSGEGLQGLSAAFLSAGVPAVVATLWPVDDEATARFMEAFYRALARGVTAAGALGVARAELVRSRRYAHPFYWAGVVLVGDADVRAPLRARPFAGAAPWLLGTALGAVAAGFAWGAARRTRRERV
jgi:CHAT domain-containing protein